MLRIFKHSVSTLISGLLLAASVTLSTSTHTSAPVHYQYGTLVEDSVPKLEYGHGYKRNSVFLDALIVVDTRQAVLSGKDQ